MTTRLARRLIEPDYWTCPHGKRVRPEPALTYGPEVSDVCAGAGFAPDPQQELGLDLIFAINPDGSPASFEVCVICSRQNLKTGLFLQAVIGWLYVLDVPEVVWSAHEMATTRAAQRDLGRIIKDAPTLRKRMLPQKNDGIYDANGEERIELLMPGGTTQTVWYRARTRDGGRGLGKPKLVLDEFFAMKPAMMGALIPILLAQHQPQVLYGSSPGRADSEALFDVRERGRSGSSPRLSYLEWGNGKRPPCEDPHCTHPKTGLTYGDPCVANRLELIEHANPTLSTGRITIQTLADARQAITTAAEWFRECEGFWEEPTDNAGGIFLPGSWSACATYLEEMPAVRAIGIGVSLDLAWSSIGSAGLLDDGRLLVGATDRRSGTGWVPAEAKRIQKARDCKVVIDEKCPDPNLLKALRDEGVDVTVVKLDEYASASGSVAKRVIERRLAHCNHPELDDAVRAAKWRLAAGRRVPGRSQQSDEDISMFEGVVLASWPIDRPNDDAWGFFS